MTERIKGYAVLVITLFWAVFAVRVLAFIWNNTCGDLMADAMCALDVLLGVLVAWMLTIGRLKCHTTL